jgi:dienelactone hydrolase
MKLALLLIAGLILLPQEATQKGSCRPRPLVGVDAALRRFELPPDKFEWTLTPRKDVGESESFDLTFPSAVTTDFEENNTVWCRVWMPKDAPAPRPGVVMLHYLRGTFTPMEAAGRYFASKGIVAMLLYMPHYGRRRAADPAKRRQMIGENVEATVSNFRQAVLDIRRAGHWLACQKGVDPTRIGIFGVSMGAMVGALAAGVDGHFTRVVLVAGGGDLAAIVMNDSREIKEVRQKLIDAGWTAEKLRPALESIEPLTVAGRVDASSVLFINAENDQVIPRECTEKLRAAMGGPRMTWIKADHYTIALALPQILKQSTEHLSARPSW